MSELADGAARWTWGLALGCGVAAAVANDSLATTAAALAVVVAVLGPTAQRSWAWTLAPAVALAAGAAGQQGIVSGLLASLPVGLGLALWSLGAQAAGRFAQQRWARAWLGAVPLVVLSSVDLLSAVLTGPVGFLVDALAPLAALGRLAAGSFDLRALVTLSVAPALTVSAVAWLAATDHDARRNAGLRTVLAPIAALAVLAAIWPSPMGRTDAAAIEGGPPLQGAVTFRVFVGGALDAGERENVRRLRDLLGTVRNVGGTPVAVEWSDPVAEPLAAASATRLGVTVAPSTATLVVQNLERHRRLDPIPDLGSQPSAILALLHDLAGSTPSVDVWAFGDDVGIGAEIAGATVRSLPVAEYEATIARAEAHDGARNEMVLVMGPPALSPEDAWFVDQYAMAGGSLALLVGEADTTVGPLVGVWGVVVSGAAAGGSAIATEPIVAGSLRAEIPPRAPTFDGPDALIEPVLAGPDGPALIGVSGTVPSAMGGDSRPALRTQSRGSLRALVGSTAVLRTNPGLLRATAQWLLDRPPLQFISAPPVRTQAQSIASAVAGLVLALLGGVLLRSKR